MPRDFRCRQPARPLKAGEVPFIEFPAVNPVPENKPIDVYPKIQGKFKVMRPGAAAGFQNNVDKNRQSL